MKIRYNHQTGEKYHIDDDGYYCDADGNRLNRPEADKAHYVMSDIAAFQSPLDFTEISSRSALREHEKRHGVRQCGELNKVSDYDNDPAPAPIPEHRNPIKVDFNVNWGDYEG